MGRGVLGEDQHIATQDVIHIDPLLRQDIDKRQVAGSLDEIVVKFRTTDEQRVLGTKLGEFRLQRGSCLLYTSPSPRD